MSQPGQFEVGQLYTDGYVNGLKVYSQPGGIGTAVIPGMPQTLNGQPAAYPSLYAWGCGHRTNTAEIFTVDDPYNDIQVVLVCCCICGYIQEIISPASDYWNYMKNPLILG